MLIIGNGPSARELASKGFTELPPDVDTFGMGAAYRYFRRVDWWPTYYALADAKVVLSHRDALADIVENPRIQTKKFFFSHRVSTSPRLELIPHYSTGDFCYSKSIEMGYREIYLIGIEGDYVEEIAESRPLSEAEADELGFGVLQLSPRSKKVLRVITTTPASNPNYFFDDYQQEGDIYSLPQSNVHMMHWVAAAQLSTYYDVSTVNLSRMSKLEMFPKRDFSSLFTNVTGPSGSLRSVILFNPTIRTDVEYNFWNNFCRELRSRGYVPIIFLAENQVNIIQNNIPGIESALYTASFPWSFYLVSQSKELDNLTAHFDATRAKDISSRMSSHIIDYCSLVMARHPPKYREKVYAGLVKMVSYMELLLRNIGSSTVIVNNDTLPQPYLFKTLAQDLKINTIHSERSPFTNQWFEPEGYYALCKLKSVLPHGSRLNRFAKIGRDVIERLAHDPTAHRGLDPIALRGREEAPPLEPRDGPGSGTAGLVRSLMQRRILLPMDEVIITGWTQEGHPERRSNYPLFDSPREAISRLAKIASDLQAVLVLKPHPNQARAKFFDETRLPENVELYNGSLKPILEVADIVICFLTKVAFSALAMGKPVVTLAPNPAALCGLTFHCTRERDVAAQIRAAFEYEWTGSKRTRLAEFLGYLESEYFVANDLSNNGAKHLLAEYFPQVPLPDPEAVEDAKLLLARLDHFK